MTVFCCLAPNLRHFIHRWPPLLSLFDINLLLLECLIYILFVREHWRRRRRTTKITLPQQKKTENIANTENNKNHHIIITRNTHSRAGCVCSIHCVCYEINKYNICQCGCTFIGSACTTCGWRAINSNINTNLLTFNRRDSMRLGMSTHIRALVCVNSCATLPDIVHLRMSVWFLMKINIFEKCGAARRLRISNCVNRLDLYYQCHYAIYSYFVSWFNFRKQNE